jgi:hypothetical protein
MPLHRNLKITTGVLVIAVGTIVLGTAVGNAVAAGNQPAQATGMSFTTETSQFAAIDIGAPGPALGQGDQIVSADTVLEQGTVVGTDEVVCTVVKATPESLTCQWVMTLDLPDGQLTLQGMADGPTGQPTEPLAFSLAVTGGTGEFRGASGYADIVDNPGGTEQITVRLG